MSITQFKTSTFAQLSPEEIFHMTKLRVDVFVVEQNATTQKLMNGITMLRFTTYNY